MRRVSRDLRLLGGPGSAVEPAQRVGAVGVADDGVGDIAQEGTSQPAEPAAAYHDQVSADVLGQVDYGLVPPFAHLEVGDGDGPARLLDLSNLFVEYLLGLAPDLLAPRLGLGVVLVYDLGKRPPGHDDVEPGAGVLCQVDRLLGRQLRVRRTVGGQQYPRGEEAQTRYSFWYSVLHLSVTMVTPKIKTARSERWCALPIFGPYSPNRIAGRFSEVRLSGSAQWEWWGSPSWLCSSTRWCFSPDSCAGSTCTTAMSR